MRLDSQNYLLRRQLDQRQPPHKAKSISLLLLALWSGIAAILGYDLTQSWQQEMRAVQRESDNLLQLLDRDLTSAASKIDLLLQDIVEDFTPPMTGAQPLPDVLDTNIRLQHLQHRVPDIQENGLRIIDQTGHARYQAGQSAELPTANIADRKYFIQQKNDPLTGLLMSEPLFSRFSHSWALSLSRRINDSHGVFTGLVSAAIPIDRLQSELANIDLGRNGVIALYDTDMRLIARNPMASGEIGKSYDTPKMSTLLAANQMMGHFSMASSVDGLYRQYSFRKLAGLPLVISVGLSPDDFLSEWWRKVALFSFSLMVMLVQLAGLILLLQRQHRMARAHIDHLVTHDILTELPNRLSLEVMPTVTSNNQDSDPLALLLVDIDHFKTVNDNFGHLVGDFLLCVVAERLRAILAPGDKLGRHGGDEFVILVQHSCAPEQITALAQEILDALAEPVFLAHQEMVITSSIGIALRPLHGEDIGSLLKNAEAAMYQAKSDGRNRFQFFTEELSERLSERLLIETQLRKAIARDELRLFYQPQFNTASGQLIGFEALIRWQHPELGLISPARFIPVAEETGMIVPIGEWVLREACRQSQRWAEAGYSRVMMAVNLSAQQFRQKNLPVMVQSILAESGMPARWLELEVTESSLMQDIDRVIGTLRQLKALGLSLSIDDFGTGYSSLSYLKRFPIDKIKIDQSFVRDVHQSEDDAAIVQAVIAIAAKLRLRVIAEGVETQTHLDTLRRFECDEVQGFLFSKPLPPDQVMHFLGHHCDEQVAI